MIINLFSKTPPPLKLDRFLKQHKVVCCSSFRRSDFNRTPDFVSWQVTLIKKTKVSTNSQHFDYRQDVSLLPQYNSNDVLSMDEDSKQKQLITLATHWGLAIKKWAEIDPYTGRKPADQVVKLPQPSAASIIAYLMMEGAAIYCNNFDDWAKKKQLNPNNIKNYDNYRHCTSTGIRFNSLFDFKDQCEISDILKDF